MIDADISISEFEEIAKRAYVSVASNRTVKRNGSINQSSVAAITGLSRPEVKTLFSALPTTLKRPRSRAGRVIDGWRNDARFATSAGVTRVIPLAGSQRSFAELVRLYAGDIPPKAMLDRLQRLKLVRILAAARNQPRRVELMRTSANAHMDPQLAIVLSYLSNALRADFSKESAAISTVRLRAKDEIQLAAIGRAAYERSEAFISGLEKSFPQEAGSDQMIEIFVGLWTKGESSSVFRSREVLGKPRIGGRYKRRK